MFWIAGTEVVIHAVIVACQAIPMRCPSRTSFVVMERIVAESFIPLNGMDS